MLLIVVVVYTHTTLVFYFAHDPMYLIYYWCSFNAVKECWLNQFLRLKLLPSSNFLLALSVAASLKVFTGQKTDSQLKLGPITHPPN